MHKGPDVTGNKVKSRLLKMKCYFNYTGGDFCDRRHFYDDAVGQKFIFVIAMKKMQNADEENSLANPPIIWLQSLALPEANRLRKNLCQDLSCEGINGLHYRPFPKRK